MTGTSARLHRNHHGSYLLEAPSSRRPALLVLWGLVLLLCGLWTPQHNVVVVVQAFSTGAGGCPAGAPGVTGPHLSNPAGVTEQPFDDLYSFTVADESGAAVTSLVRGESYQVTVRATGPPFRGALIRLDGSGLLDASLASLADMCAASGGGAVGLTHADATPKTELAGVYTIPLDAPETVVNVDVTIVEANNANDGSKYSYKAFALPVVDAAAAAAPSAGGSGGGGGGGATTTTAAPVSTPVPDTAAAPVGMMPQPIAAPVAAPVTAPVAAPVAAPGTAPVTAPVAAAPMSMPVAVPVTDAVPAPVMAPVAAPVTAAPVVVAPVSTPVVVAPVDTPVAMPSIPIAPSTSAPRAPRAPVPTIPIPWLPPNWTPPDGTRTTTTGNVLGSEPILPPSSNDTITSDEVNGTTVIIEDAFGLKSNIDPGSYWSVYNATNGVFDPNCLVPVGTAVPEACCYAAEQILMHAELQGNDTCFLPGGPNGPVPFSGCVGEGIAGYGENCTGGAVGAGAPFVAADAEECGCSFVVEGGGCYKVNDMPGQHWFVYLDGDACKTMTHDMGGGNHSTASPESIESAAAAAAWSSPLSWTLLLLMSSVLCSSVTLIVL